MSNDNATSPAYPFVFPDDVRGPDGRFAYAGMTKREAFAMAAMQGMCANPSIIGPSTRCGWDYVNCTPEVLAQAALLQADAQLAELSKPASSVSAAHP